MIKYKLNCKSCNKSFDSWFASSKEFDKLKKLKLVDCKFCNSLDIAKSLMAPNVLNNFKKKSKIIEEDKKLKIIRNKMRNYQKFIKKNLEYVGDNFAYEARTIHYGKDKNKKGIYGKATNNQIKELNEEGIETQTLPWIDENKN